MSLESALSIASSGLANISAQYAVISQNVANAGTPSYAVESLSQTNVEFDGQGMGVRTGIATIDVNQALQASVLQQNATATGLTTTQTALQSIDSALGTVTDGSDVGSLLGSLQNAFSSLETDPSSQTQQSVVVSAASTLASGINSLSQAYTTQGQAAQDDLSASVKTMNSTLATITQLNGQIVEAKVSGQSTADLQNQQNAAVQTLSSLVSIKTIQQADGTLSVYSTNDVPLAIGSSVNSFSIADSTYEPGAYYPGGGLSGIMLNGTDVTSGMTGGQIGADLTLRDTTLPTDQAELDEFSANLSTRFASQGLTLFTDGSGNVPSSGGTPAQSGYVGFASEIQVNPQVSAKPSLVRDGTNSVSGSATGASAFTTNPASGPQGFTTLISRVLDYSLGSDAQSGVAQPAFNNTGLGASGTLSASFGSSATLSSYAGDMVASQSQQSANTTSAVTTEQALQTSLNSQLSTQSGVNIDAEMSNMISLQNAYGANAKVITTLQAMFTVLINMDGVSS